MTGERDEVPNGPTDELLEAGGDDGDDTYVKGVKDDQPHVPPATIETREEEGDA